MRLIIQADEDDVAEWVSVYIQNRILAFKPTQDKPFLLGLPTGRSPIRTYHNLVKLYRNGNVSFEHVVTFNMDEYCGIPADHPHSYHTFMWNHLFKHIDIRRENVNFLDGNAPDLLAECARYEQKIQDLGGIELFLGGIGSDGHIAFNEPGSSLTSRTRVKALAYDTIVENATKFFGGNLEKTPKKAMTVGIGTIMDAREVIIIIVVEEGVNHMWTVSMLQMHRRACIVCDEDATMELKVKTVKYFAGLRQAHQKQSGNGDGNGGDGGGGPGIGEPLGDTNSDAKTETETEDFLYGNKPLERSNSSSSISSLTMLDVSAAGQGGDIFTSPRNQVTGSMTSRSLTGSSRKRKAPPIDHSPIGGGHDNQ